jgi:hypothetical protein
MLAQYCQLSSSPHYYCTVDVYMCFHYGSVSQTVVRGQVVFGFCPCGPLRLNISPKKTEKNIINVNCISHTIVENLKQFAFNGDKSRVDQWRTQNFFSGGVQQIQLKTEGRENRDRGR